MPGKSAEGVGVEPQPGIFEQSGLPGVTDIMCYSRYVKEQSMSTALVSESIRLGPELAGTLMTTDEFDAAGDCDERWNYELIHGVLVVVPPPSEGERGPNEELGYLLRRYQRQHPQGKALDWTLPQSFIKTANRRRADRVIWTGLGRTPSVRRDLPTIAVEFVSEGKRNRQRDYVEKRDEYVTAGIEEYWIIDRFSRTMTVVTNHDSGELVLRENENVYNSAPARIRTTPGHTLCRVRRARRCERRARRLIHTSTLNNLKGRSDCLFFCPGRAFNRSQRKCSRIE